MGRIKTHEYVILFGDKTHVVAASKAGVVQVQDVLVIFFVMLVDL